MNIKLRRTARTPYSEEIAIFDADSRDEGGEPVNIGKLDVHYVDDQIVGTLLIWAEYATNFNRTRPADSGETMTDLIDEILGEVSEPLGVAAEYGIEVYYPRLDQHEFVANYDEDEEEELEGEYADDEVGLTDERDGRIH
jgi:hypothetical protein